uniref:Uncharacterized protein n=1 Tax=Plectus sambesii TaxID=2011161 RepID=A0A914WFC5_9BILA
MAVTVGCFEFLTCSLLLASICAQSLGQPCDSRDLLPCYPRHRRISLVDVLRDPHYVTSMNEQAWEKALSQLKAYQELFGSENSADPLKKKRSIARRNRSEPVMTGIAVINATSVRGQTSRSAEFVGDKWASSRGVDKGEKAAKKPKNSNMRNGIQSFGRKRNGKVVPISQRIHERHLEMEPLCCLSSCVVRGGCSAVIGFELFFVGLTLLAIVLRIVNSNFDFWPSLELTFPAIIQHHVVLYLIVVFDIVILGMASVLSTGLVYFDKKLVRVHWWFQFPAIALCLLGLIVFVMAIVTGPACWDAPNVLLIAAFAFLIPVELWAISVVNACHKYFVLCHVFVTLADS